MHKFHPVLMNFYYGGSNGSSGVTAVEVEQIHETVNQVHQTKTFGAIVIAICIIVIFYMWALCLVWSAERGSAFPWIVTIVDRTAAHGKAKLTKTRYEVPKERSLFKMLTLGLATAHEVSPKGLTIVMVLMHIVVLFIVTSIGYKIFIAILLKVLNIIREVLTVW